MCTIRLRRQKAIIHYHRPNKQTKPVEYYYCPLLLFYPWLVEEDYLTVTDDSYFHKYEELKLVNKNKFEKDNDDIEAALQELQSCNYPTSC